MDTEKPIVHKTVHDKLLAAGWLPVTDAQKDGETYLLLVVNDEPCTFDDSAIGRVVGFNSLADTGEDVWFQAGWDWCQDRHINISIEALYYKELPQGLEISTHELEHGLDGDQP